MSTAHHIWQRQMIEAGMIKPMVYRGWHISHDPPPIPLRDFDWQAHHRDYDAWNDGDGWQDNGLKAHAPTYLALIDAIDVIEDERVAA